MARINFYRQPSSNECGPTSLKIILAYYGVYVQEWELLEKFPQQKDGWDFIQYTKAAFAYGLKTEVLSLAFADIIKMPLPVVIAAHNHYVVLHKITGRKYHIADPAFGNVVYKEEEFKRHFCDNKCITVLNISKLPFFKGKGRALTNIDLIRNFGNYFHNYKYTIIKALIIVLIISVSQIMLPFITRSIVDTGIQTSSWSFIEILLFGNIILILANILGTFTHTYLITHVTNRIKISMLEDYMSKVLTLQYITFMSTKVGDLLQRISDNERIQSFLSGCFLNTFVSFLILTVFSVILYIFNSKLFIIYSIFAIIYIIWTTIFLKQRKKLDFDFWNIKSENNKIIIQTYDNIVDIKGFNYVEKYSNKWRKNIHNLFKQNMSFFYYSQFQEVGGNLILQAKDIFLTYLSCSYVLDGSITLGTLFAIQYILGTLNTPLYKFADFFNQFQLVMISLNRIAVFSNLPDDQPKEGIPFIPRDRNITLRNINFQYPDGTIGLLRINMTFAKGKKYGIIGHSGCGKSTLLKLLCGIIPPETGDMWLGTTNIKSIDWGELKKHISIDLQENRLIEGTILENIVGDAKNYNEDRLIKCVEIARIRNEIEMLPEAYNTLIEGEHRKMSQGQRQRLLIARAIYKEADIYLFDEIANCLSPDLEKSIVNRIDSFLADKTRIYVTHRPECLKDSDLMIVMDKGAIIDLGNYEELEKKEQNMTKKDNSQFIPAIQMTTANVLLSIIIILFSVIIIGLLLIQKPDEVTGRFNIYTADMPRSLTSKVEGEIIYLKKGNEAIHGNVDIAYIRTSSDYNQIKVLEELISKGDLNDIRTNLSKASFSMLGELSGAYYDFIHSLEVFQKQENDKVHRYDKIISEISTETYEHSYETQKQNLELEKENLKIIKQSYLDDSILYSKNAITKVAFNNSKANYLMQQKQVDQAYNQLIQLANRIRDEKTSHSRIDAQYNNEITNDESNAYYRLRILRASINEWRNKYVLTAPCSGNLEYSVYIENGQIVASGTEIARVLPHGNSIKALLFFPTINTADVHIGSKVKLILDNYDQYSYGYMDAVISKKSSSVSSSADGGTFYTGELDLDMSKQEHFKGEFKFAEGMSGRALIIIKEKNLLEKIFNWIHILTN